MGELNYRAAETDDMNYRAAPVKSGGGGGPKTIDEETRSVEVVAATEQPVMVWDYERRGMVNEILLMSGCKLPKSRQIPLLDTHQRYSASSVIGSARELAIVGDELISKTFFASDEDTEKIWSKVREGHLTDVSIGYRVTKKQYVAEGETKTIKGREFTGPASIGTEWTPKELSVCPIGADTRAKARAYNEENHTQENPKMDEKTRKILETLGLPETATEDEIRTAMDKMKAPQVDVDKERSTAAIAERERVVEIEAMCRKFNVADNVRSELIDTGKTIDLARKAVLDAIDIKDPQPPAMRDVLPETQHPATIVADEKDKFRSAAEASILIRSGSQDFAVQSKVPGALDLAGYTMVELARQALRIAGRPLGGDIRDVVGRALTISDFPYILQNVAHKSIWMGWEDAGETWNLWCNTGSVSDFKTHYSPRISEFSDLEEIPEMDEYKYGIRTEAQESYKIATYGKLAGISRQAIINDDLSAITSNFMGMGEAAARKIGDLPIAVLTANAVMGDSIALFDAATHGNYVASGGAAPGIATIGAAELAMANMKDLQGKRRLNIKPMFYLAPNSLKSVSEIFFKTEKFSDTGTPATDSTFASTRWNPYAGDYIKRIYEGRLDDASVTAWYLAARKGRTVTIFFLNGNQTPYLEQQQQFTVDGMTFKVRIDAGAKAMDYRGLYSNVGV